MNRHFIDINDFTILVETAEADVPTVDTCFFDEPVIAVAFYGSGNVHLDVRFEDRLVSYDQTKGLALSFYADDKVEFVHTVSAAKPLECIVIATRAGNLHKLPEQEHGLFAELLQNLVEPIDHFVEGPRFLMPPVMQSTVDQLFHTKYTGKARIVFFKSQITSLLAHYFGQLSLITQNDVSDDDAARLLKAKEILNNNLESPPSLSELSRMIGLNTYKLKKNFKEAFGVPVFKYLQNQRLDRAYDLLRNRKMTVQEAAWDVGYDSLSSFSNAFAKKFGFRPSEIKG